MRLVMRKAQAMLQIIGLDEETTHRQNILMNDTRTVLTESLLTAESARDTVDYRLPSLRV
jgi:hypothetical protein